jgi:hypothetical protein
MGPPNIQRGDRVYVLLGCSLPVILRPCGEEHEKLFQVGWRMLYAFNYAWRSVRMAEKGKFERYQDGDCYDLLIFPVI